MFKKNDKSLLEEAIATLHDEMANYTGDTDEYTKMVDNLSKLYKLRENDSRKSVSPDTIAMILGNLATVAMIVGHERTNVITSKAIAFVGKLR